MSILWLDLETFNTVDLSESGVHRYCASEDLRVLLFAYAVDDEPARVWQCEYEPMPADLRVWLDEAGELVAHNAPFDRNVLETLGYVKPDIERWFCTMAQALTLSLPGKLSVLCRALNISEDEAKVKDGTRLVRKFTRPRKPTKNNPATRWTRENAPDDWARFVEYARMDVEAMRTCSKLMPRYNFERKVWALDQRMNDRGFFVDVDLCRAARVVAEQEAERLNRRLVEVTRGRVTKPTQVARIRSWLDDNGLSLPSLGRDILEGAVARPGLSQDVRDVVTARLEGGRSTAAKYATLLAGTDRDRRARGCFQYSGAGQTMRWAGRRFQPQNLFRPVVDCHAAAASILTSAGLSGPEAHAVIEMLWHPTPVLDVVASAVRGALVAAPGHTLLVWDLSQIEARVTFWYARGLKMLEAFADPSRDPYRETATDIGSDSRQLGKCLVLACGFGMGGPVFQSTAAKPPYHIDMDEDTAKAYVYGWRDANPEVPQLWRDVENAARRAIVDQTRIRHTSTGLVFAFERLAKRRGTWRGCLTITLPSGHRLVYWDAEVNPADDRISYTRFNEGIVPGWDIWGGGFVENIVQMTARHIMAGALVRTDEFAPVVGTVHDEGVAETPQEHAEEHFVKMGEAFHWVPSWARFLPNGGPALPLAAEGYMTTRYRK